MMLLALFPQFNLWAMRGKDWNGAYAYNDVDEVAYAAYLQALIDGRPRRNDPYTGRDDATDARQPESLFSIQFIPPYAMALAARPFGLNASSMMIIISALAALATALALFWLLGSITNDDRVAATGALVVLCLGTLACAQGAIVQVLGHGWAYPYLPFLRRYLPALPFPFFFLFCALVWRSIRNEKKRAFYLYAVGAGLSFGVLVYSYFYLWTTAAAWLACFAVLMLIARPEGWKRDFKSLGVTIALATFALVPYFILLSKRAETMDSVQLLTLTHRPDLLRPPFLIGVAVLAILVYAIKRKRLEWKDRRTLFAAAFALTPLVVFNQQVITGRSLQPIHYEVFIVNYVAATALVLTTALLWRTAAVAEKRKLTTRLLLSIALLAFGWGAVEADITTHVIDDQNVIRDEATPVGRRLRELARESEQNGGDSHAVVYAPNMIEGDDLPTLAPESLLWSRHLHIFSGATWQESKERFYQQLYYAGLDARWLESELSDGNHVVVIALFGWGRNQDRLTVNSSPLTDAEITDEVNSYSQYLATFNRERAAHPLLSYVVTDADGSFDFAKLDRWYERDAGERVGKFMLYHVKLKPEEIKKEKEKRKRGA
ncbi:MAG: hypothetical protein QOC96_2004 [Acidobacteriota bacterium]|jgi:hypothetical protein|nr:hypothetical protein [Acidobacteriota bacterium]